MNVELNEHELYHIALGLRTVYEYQGKLLESLERNPKLHSIGKIENLRKNRNEVKEMLDKFHLLASSLTKGETNVS